MTILGSVNWYPNTSTNSVVCAQNNMRDNRIILLDYDFINDVNGLTVLKHIRQVNRFASVIMLSGQDNLEAAIETLRHGAADYFVKTNKTVFANVLSSIIKLMELGRIAEN
jgi:response regulator of citrate/malate metabolism